MLTFSISSQKESCELECSYDNHKLACQVWGEGDASRYSGGVMKTYEYNARWNIPNSQLDILLSKEEARLQFKIQNIESRVHWGRKEIPVKVESYPILTKVGGLCDDMKIIDWKFNIRKISFPKNPLLNLMGTPIVKKMMSSPHFQRKFLEQFESPEIQSELETICRDELNY